MKSLASSVTMAKVVSGLGYDLTAVSQPFESFFFGGCLFSGCLILLSFVFDQRFDQFRTYNCAGTIVQFLCYCSVNRTL